MVTDTLITDEVKSYIGREADPARHEVDATSIRNFARAVGYSNPIYYDSEVARSRGYRGLVAPFGYLGLAVYNPDPAARSKNPLRLPKLPVKRRLNGGTELTQLNEICAGDELTVTHRIEDIYEREGRSGPMVVIVIAGSFVNQLGELVAEQKTSLIRY